MKSKIINHIKANNNNLPEYRFGSLHVFVQTPMTEDVDMRSVFLDIAGIVPDQFLSLVDVVYIGDFSFLKKRNINAMYMDNAIYVSNEQDDEDDLKDDIVHELAHAVEEKYGPDLYDDRKIEKEFLLKREKLRNILSNEGYDVDSLDFSNISFDEKFDNAMYEEVGYDALRMLAVNIFLGPYSTASLREYFARGFEEYFLGNQLYLKDVCPYLFHKLSLLVNQNIEEERYEDWNYQQYRRFKSRR